MIGEKPPNNIEGVGINNLRSAEPLSRKVVRGGLWVFGLRITNRGLALIRTIILARLLAPEDFGLLGIAMLAISALETFSQTGFQTALVQKKEDVESYLDTAWTVSAIRGAVLFLILFFSAPVIAKFFNSQDANLVIKVIAVTTLLLGFRNIGIVFFQKELEFNKQFIYELSGALVDLTVAISLAFILQNVWALVWGGLAGNFVRLLMSYIIHPFRPKIKFEKTKFDDLFGFGKWVLGSSIAVFVLTQGDDIFVGKVLGVTALGFYQMAYMLSNSPATEISHVISRVTFPAYSKLQNDLTSLREAYLKVLQITAFISVPLGVLVLILAPEFTQIFLGNKWIPMVPAMKVLAVCGIIRSLGATIGPVFEAVGEPKILTKLTSIKLLALLLLIYPLTKKYGLVGTSLSVLGASLIANPVADYKLIKLINCRFWDFLKNIIFPLFSALIMCVIVSIMQFYSPIDSVVEFALALMAGLFAFSTITLLLGNRIEYNLRGMLIFVCNNFR